MAKNVKLLTSLGKCTQVTLSMADAQARFESSCSLNSGRCLSASSATRERRRSLPQMPSGQGKKGHPFCWLVEFKGNPSPKKKWKKRAPLGNWVTAKAGKGPGKVAEVLGAGVCQPGLGGKRDRFQQLGRLDAYLGIGPGHV